MTRSEVRTLINDAVDALAQSTAFNAGRITEFNSQPGKTYPFAWLETLKDSPDLTAQQLPISNWDCLLIIAKKDETDSLPVQYEALIDACDEIAKKIAVKINLVIQGYKLITLTGQHFEPFVKKLADCTSGIEYSFVLSVPDTTNRC